MSDPQDIKMNDLERKVDKLEDAVERALTTQERNASEQAKTNKELGELVTQIKLLVQSNSHQNEKQSDLIKRIEKLEEGFNTITIERSEEKQSREFLMKYWHWLFLFSVFIVGVVAAVASSLGRAIPIN